MYPLIHGLKRQAADDAFSNMVTKADLTPEQIRTILDCLLENGGVAQYATIDEVREALSSYLRDNLVIYDL